MPSVLRDSLLFTLFIALLCALAGYPAIVTQPYFLGDDFGLVQLLHDKPLARLLSYFASDWTEGIYGTPYDELRPLLALSYRIDSSLWGATNVLGYHLTNTLLHFLNCLAVGAITGSLIPGNWWAALSAASLFALAPSHSETISWISGRVDSLTGVSYLYGFLLFALFRLRASFACYVGSLFLFVCGLFTKQSLIPFPLLILAFDLVCRTSTRQKSLRGRAGSALFATLPYFLILLLYLVLRLALFGNAVREDAISLSLLIDFLDRQSFYLRALLLPLPLDLSWYALSAILAAGALAGGVYAVYVLWLVIHRSDHRDTLRQILFFGPIWYLVTVSPMAVAYTSARHLYVTSAGVCIALALVILPPSLERRFTRGVCARIMILCALLFLNWTALHRNTMPWIENGTQSRKACLEVPELMRTVPAGSPVVISLPATDRGVWMWSWALPFALQRPFTQEDIYSQFGMIEPVDAYCCPVEQWWAAKRPLILSLLEDHPPEKTLYVVHSDAATGSVVLRRKTVRALELGTMIERALGRSPEVIGNDMTTEEAHRLFSLLRS